MKKFQGVGLIFLMIPIFLSGCSDELVRVRFKEAGEKMVKFQHAGDELEFWTDYDVEYISVPEMYYEIQILDEGNKVKEFICNPLEVEGDLMKRDVVVRGITKQSYVGLMKCGATFPEGDTTIKVKFFVNGDSLTIFRADLVVKDGD